MAKISAFEGRLSTPGLVSEGDLAVFAEAGGDIDFDGTTETGFVRGSAVKLPHDRSLGFIPDTAALRVSPKTTWVSPGTSRECVGRAFWKTGPDRCRQVQ